MFCWVDEISSAAEHQVSASRHHIFSHIPSMPSTTMLSPFASQLGMNYCPSDPELAQVKAFLVEPCLRLKSLDEEIAVLRQALDKLTAERHALGAYVDAHKALLSPVRRLPLDIIGLIFMACLPTHRNCVMSAKEAPVLLGRICSSWRAISLSTPRLWSRLHIVGPTRFNSVSSEDHHAKVAQRLEVADAWLRRSGTCPLSISLEGKLDLSVQASPFRGPAMAMRRYPLLSSSPFLEVLLPFASRWQHMDLVLSPGSHKALSGLIEDDVPLLSHLRIFLGPEARDISFLTQLGILHAPNLTSFSVVGDQMNFLHLPLRWHQLTALSFDGTSNVRATQAGQTPETVLTILSRCPQLRTVHFLIHDSAELQLSDVVVECSFLHTVDLHCVGNPLHTAGLLLSRLWLPSFRNFKLDGIEHVGFQRIRAQRLRAQRLLAQTTASAKLLRSSIAESTHLESISLDSAVFSTPDLIHFLLGLPPTVLRLEIAEPLPVPGQATFRGRITLDDGVMKVLDASSEGPTPCPALEELVVIACRAVSDKALLSFIKSRLPTLRYVRVAFERERQIDILPELQHLTGAENLKISLTYVTFPAPSFSPWGGLPDAPLPVSLTS
ncbi:hypothetical protein MSAN_00079800 [Mycena sanguinolenta]|uniref:F-box domain-containing protein n=1 Tax=Mycena sanguinolenta TaxID=230812 RepID=A0A8H7DJL3_9AGAR|nr:hypothetical protein MSAN_00079800 [Mycena sanguinolenta]